MSELTQEERDYLREENVDDQALKDFLPALQTGRGWDILCIYGQLWKANLLAELVNKTDAELKASGMSHDRITGQIAGIVMMLKAPEELLAYAESQLAEVEKEDV